MSAVPPNPPEPGVLLSLDKVTTYYGQMRILEGISLHVGEGELVCLLGGNASGKSTTLKTILGIVRPRSGRAQATCCSAARTSRSGRCRSASPPGSPSCRKTAACSAS